MNAVFARPACHDALARLNDKHLLKSLAYIGGRWVANAANSTFEVRDPATSVPLAWVCALNATETSQAIDAAACAFPKWRSLLPQERAKILRRWYEMMLAAKDDLALIMTLEQGKPLAESKGEIDYAASFIEWYAEEGKRLNAESVTSHLPEAEMIVRREALGVVGIVTPWNFPSAMITRKAAAALAAGCTVVAHPSSETPLSALALAELGERAGIPAGVFNVVTGDAATIVGRLCEDSRVRALSFTGSTEIGKLIAGQCAPTLKRLVMELGGHAPLIVFDDADVDKAVDIAINAKFATSGQDCLAANRIFVQRPILNAFNAAFKARIEMLKVGDGLQPGVDIGPLMHERAVTKVHEHVTDAIKRGAQCLTGGTRHPGWTLVLHPDAAHRRAQRCSDHVGRNLRASRCHCRFRHRGRGDRPRQRHRIRPRCLCRHRKRRTPDAARPGLGLWHGRDQPGQDHRRPHSLWRLETIRSRPRRIAARHRGFHRTQISLHRHSGLMAQPTH